MKTTYAPFDVADYLNNNEAFAGYLSAVADDPNPAVFIAALDDVAKARGMEQIAKDAGIGREHLYKALTVDAHPRFETIKAVLHAIGVKFEVVAERGTWCPSEQKVKTKTLGDESPRPPLFFLIFSKNNKKK
ncbi:MAG: putative addiction module antidote protein [Magnetococcus sp. YQC-5]